IRLPKVRVQRDDNIRSTPSTPKRAQKPWRRPLFVTPSLPFARRRWYSGAGKESRDGDCVMRISTVIAAGLLFFAWINPPAAQPKPPTSEMNTGPKDFMSQSLNQWMLDLRHADPSVRDKAIRAIVQFGPAAREAVPALVDQTYNMQDGDPRVRAVIALG